MKRVSVFLAFFMLVGFGLQAQSSNCAKKSKAACASKTEAAKATSADDNASMEAAAKLASLDENIEQRVCEKSGAVSYVRKETCSHSGKVSYVNVSYDAETAQFVNVSPKDLEAAGEKKACCAKGAGEGKGCCASKASASGCTGKAVGKS